jgi:hypothetical protein
MRIGIGGGSLNRPHIEFQKGNTNQSWSILAGANSYFQIKPNLADVAPDDTDAIITIMPNGPVGIGTANPAHKLDVTGQIRAYSDSSDAYTGDWSGGTNHHTPQAYDALIVQNPSTTGDFTSIFLKVVGPTTGAGTGRISLVKSAAYDADLTFH